MIEQKFDKGGYIPGGSVRVLIIPWADRGKPLPLDWNPLLIVRAEECIVNSDLRCTRADHPHEDPS